MWLNMFKVSVNSIYESRIIKPERDKKIFRGNQKCFRINEILYLGFMDYTSSSEIFVII